MCGEGYRTQGSALEDVSQYKEFKEIKDVLNACLSRSVDEEASNMVMNLVSGGKEEEEQMDMEST